MPNKPVYVAQYRLYPVANLYRTPAGEIDKIVFRPALLYSMPFQSLLDAGLYFGTIMMYGEVCSEHESFLLRGKNGFDYWNRLQAKSLIGGQVADVLNTVALHMPSIVLYQDVTDKLWTER